MKTKLLCVLIGILALVHVWLVLPAIQDPDRFQLRDSYDYLDLARSLLSTGRYEVTEYPGVDLLRPPGYPAFLVIGLWIGQGQTAIISVMQVLIMFITAWLLYRICKELGHRQVGLIAIIFYLLNPNAAFWSLVLLTETLASFWLVLGMWCLVHYWTTSQRRWTFLAGLTLAASSITRPILLPLAIGLGVLFFLLEWRRTHKSSQALNVSLIFIVGLLVLVIPWQLRNQVVHGWFTLSEVGESTFQNWYVAQTLAQVEGISRDEAVAIIANSPDPMQYSLGVIREHPAIFLKEQVRGIMRTMLGAEYGSWAKVWGGEQIATSGVLSAFIDLGSPGGILRALASQTKNPWFWAGIYALLYDILLYTAVLLGIWRVLRNYSQEPVFYLTALLIFSLIYLLILPGVAGESRFRVPADPLLAIVAGMAFLPSQRMKVVDDRDKVE